MADKRGPGRRPGGPDTRGEILAAARAEFLGQRFRRHDDAVLVHHDFGAKEDLFLAALEFPFDPPERAQLVVSPGA